MPATQPPPPGTAPPGHPTLVAFPAGAHLHIGEVHAVEIAQHLVDLRSVLQHSARRLCQVVERRVATQGLRESAGRCHLWGPRLVVFLEFTLAPAHSGPFPPPTVTSPSLSFSKKGEKTLLLLLGDKRVRIFKLWVISHTNNESKKKNQCI